MAPLRSMFGLLNLSDIIELYTFYACLSFCSKVRPRTFECLAMGSAMSFILRFRLLLYSAGSGVNRVQVILSGFSVRLFCPDKNFM